MVLLRVLMVLLLALPVMLVLLLVLLVPLVLLLPMLLVLLALVLVLMVLLLVLLLLALLVDAFGVKNRSAWTRLDKCRTRSKHPLARVLLWRALKRHQTGAAAQRAL